MEVRGKSLHSVLSLCLSPPACPPRLSRAQELPRAYPVSPSSQPPAHPPLVGFPRRRQAPIAGLPGRNPICPSLPQSAPHWGPLPWMKDGLEM